MSASIFSARAQSKAQLVHKNRFVSTTINTYQTPEFAELLRMHLMEETDYKL